MAGVVAGEQEPSRRVRERAAEGVGQWHNAPLPALSVDHEGPSEEIFHQIVGVDLCDPRPPHPDFGREAQHQPLSRLRVDQCFVVREVRRGLRDPGLHPHLRECLGRVRRNEPWALTLDRGHGVVSAMPLPRG